MSDFNIRSDSVDVEQIMQQIRARIKEKRGVDYTEEQVRELATVRLEKFLDPKNLRSDLLEQFRNSRPPLPEIPTDPIELPDPPKEPPPAEPPYQFDAETLYRSHRAPLRFIRRLLAPILKLFFNPNTLVQILHTQSQFNLDVIKRDLRRRVEFEQELYAVRTIQKHFERHGQVLERSRAEWNLLYYEVLHNLVLETTRNGIEVKNLRMRVEALASRLDFSERRVRALEGVVQYRPEVVRSRSGAGRPDNRERDRDRDRDASRDRAARVDGEGGEESPPASAETNGAPAAAAVPGQGAQGPSGESTGRRRRRRRRGRRGLGSTPGSSAGAPTQTAENDTADEDYGEGDELDTAVDEGPFHEAGGADPREGAPEPDDRRREQDGLSSVGGNGSAPSDEAERGTRGGPDQQ
jgi:hypothetical protein